MTASRHFPLAIVTLLMLVGLARAEEPLPAGYERMLLPTAKSQSQLAIVPEWGKGPVGAYSIYFAGTEGYRIVDLEINAFNPKPTYEDDSQFGHMVSYVEVPNEGQFEVKSGAVAVGIYPSTIFEYWEWKNWRPIDIELYYRHDPMNGALYATYAYVGVENTGKDFAEWDWVPPMPLATFLDVLDDMSQQYWRPYDVEFAVDESGQVVGTALLARDSTFDNPSDFSSHVPTMWTFFSPEELPALTDEGWQLLDVELTLKGRESRDPLVPTDQFPLVPYFGIFVNTSFTPLEPTATEMLTKTAENELTQQSADLQGTARLIDLEIDGYVDLCKRGEVCEAFSGYYTHTNVWLWED